MSKRRNIVILTGPLSLGDTTTVYLDDEEVSVAICTVETDRPALGGRHRVYTYGNVARAVAAFWYAGGGVPLDCTVDGWLRTNERGSVVVGEKVTFHVGPEVCEAARGILDSLAEAEAGAPASAQEPAA
jgi:hypothetical protein